MVKLDKNISSSRSKSRKRHFQASSAERRRLMCSPLSKELRGKHNAKAVPIRKDDEVKIVRGRHKNKEGKVMEVYRKKWAVHVERITREKVNGSSVYVPLDASNLVVTKLKLDKDRKALLERKGSQSRNAKRMQEVD